MKNRLIKIISMSAAAAVLAACGSDEQTANQPPAERGVVTSAFECPELLNVEIADCEKAIEEAKALHSKKSATYKTEEKCETTEGKGRCERSGEDSFGPRLQAFLVTASKKPKAVPLYPTKDGTSGFQEGSGAKILTDSETIKFSDEAYDLGESNVSAKSKR